MWLATCNCITYIAPVVTLIRPLKRIYDFLQSLQTIMKVLQTVCVTSTSDAWTTYSI